MSRPAPQQVVRLEVVPVFGPEPIGAAQVDGVFGATLERDITGTGMPQLRDRAAKGLTGSPAQSTGADLGPLQGDFSKVRTVGAPNANRPGFATSLPNTANGQSGSIQDRMAALGI